MKTVNGTTYKDETPDCVVSILEDCRQRGSYRLRIHYGDTKTGRFWGDIETGTVGRSCGPIKIPLLIATANSIGGEGVLDHCILKIEHANKKNGGVLYLHPLAKG